MKPKEDNIVAEVILSLNKEGEKERVQFITEKVSLLNIDKETMVLNIVGDDGVNITVKFTKVIPESDGRVIP
jgi:hypothetical protein